MMAEADRSQRTAAVPAMVRFIQFHLLARFIQFHLKKRISQPRLGSVSMGQTLNLKRGFPNAYIYMYIYMHTHIYIYTYIYITLSIWGYNPM